MLARLERIPKGGETILYEDWRFTIVMMAGRRITKVKIEKLGGGGPSNPASLVEEQVNLVHQAAVP
jgi:CBS domain containing-hemolysin-like protein